MINKKFTTVLKYKDVFKNVIFVILLINWVTLLAEGSDSYKMPYIVVAFVGAFSYYFIEKNKSNQIDKKNKIMFGVASSIFSFVVPLANYKFFSPIDIKNFMSFGVMLIAGYLISYYIFCATFVYMQSKNVIIKPEQTLKYSPAKVFIVSMIIISSVYFFVFSLYFPGLLSRDSLTQIYQIKNDSYSNHHPFYHTMIIKFFMFVGMSIFNDINYAVATYIVFQILSMSVIFSFIVSTIYQKYNSTLTTVLTLMWFAFYPMNVMYSFTMWKDVLFSGMVSLMLLLLFRIFNNIGKEKFNHILFCFSIIGIGLLRSNGIFSLVVSFMIFLVLFRKKYKKILLEVLIMLCFCCILKGPVLGMLNVIPPDTIESLSIPAQQIARVVADGNELSQTQIDLLNKIVDTSKIPERYSSHISDSIKDLVRETKNQEYILDNKFEFINLYISLGLKYPQSYINAYVDQTRGYWNSGYQYWIWSEKITPNSYGISSDTYSTSLKNMWEQYLVLYQSPKVPIFQITISIGFFVWFIVYQFVIMVALKRKKDAFMAVPILAIVLSLLVATPVFGEYRYIYSMFTSMPIIMVTMFGAKQNALNFNFKDSL